MSLIHNFRNLFGIGPTLLFVFLLIEGITIHVNQWKEYNIGFSFSVQIVLTVCILIVLLAGIIWFNRTLDLIQTSFLRRERKLVIQGPFLYVRHPLYATLMFTIPPFFLIWFDDYLYVVPWLLILLVSHLVVKFEETGLIREFGNSYQEYKLYVPALIPYRGANGRKILDKESC